MFAKIPHCLSRYAVKLLTRRLRFDTMMTEPLMTWFHCAIVLECPNCQASIYHNGLVIGTTTEVLSVVAPGDGSVRMGKGNTAFSSLEVDELVFFNENLSAEKIWALYTRYGKQAPTLFFCGKQQLMQGLSTHRHKCTDLTCVGAHKAKYRKEISLPWFIYVSDTCI